MRISYYEGPPIIEVGDILIGGESNGYLRRVLAVTVRDSIVILETEYATLAEAIRLGSFSVDTVFDPWKALVRRGEEPEVPDLHGISLGDDGFRFKDVSLFDGQVEGTELTVVVEEGLVRFVPRVELEAEWDYGASHFKTIVTGDIEVELVLSTAVSGSLELDYATELVPPIPLGRIPVVGPLYLSIELGLEAGFRISTEEHGRLGQHIRGHASVQMGATWDKNVGWEDRFKDSLQFESNGVDWALGGQTEPRGFIRPYVSTRLVDTAGPYLAVTPFLEFQGFIDSPAWEWKLQSGINGDLGFDVSVFGHEIVDHFATIAGTRVLVLSDRSESTILIQENFDADTSGFESFGEMGEWQPESGDWAFRSNRGEDLPQAATVREIDYDPTDLIQFDFDVTIESGCGDPGNPNLAIGLSDSDFSVGAPMTKLQPMHSS